jgi:hypothetical protein
MSIDDVIALLQEIQLRTYKCHGFVKDHVYKEWIIDMLNKYIEELEERKN